MEKSVELEELAQQEQKKAQDEALWTNPANGIINGISKNDNVNPARAIWEMVQNARDLTEGKANIIFELTDNELIFSHDGKPFNAKTIKALILQTSSKDADDKTQTGQYGTGFLTTHLFGRIINLDGAFQTIPNKDFFYNFKDFVIDRDTDNKEEMIVKLKNQCAEAEQWANDSSKWDNTPKPLTTFRYQLSNVFEKGNAHKAFELAPLLTPFVLTYNTKVKSITFKNNGRIRSFTSGDVEEIQNCGDYRYMSFSYSETGGNKEQEEKKVFFLQSRAIDENSNEPYFTVVLPLEERDGNVTVLPYNTLMPNLYINLPLMGTENFGCNFFIHSPLFTCSNDNRDCLRLTANGDSYKKVAEQNCNVLRQAFTAFTDFVSNNYSKWNNVKYIAKVNFVAKDEKVKPFYEELQIILVDCFRQCELINNSLDESTTIQPYKAKVLDSNILEKLTQEGSNDADLEAVHNLMCGLFSKEVVPAQDDLAYWSQTLQLWYPDGNECFATIDDLVLFVDNPESRVEMNTLLSFDQLLKNNGLDKYFKTYRLLPNKAERRYISTDLRQPANFSKDFMDVLNIIVPSDVEKFVHPSFADIDNYVDYKDEDAKNGISARCTELADTIDKDAAQWKRCPTIELKDLTSSHLTLEQIKALSTYVMMQINDNSESFYSKVLKSVMEYFSIEIVLTSKLDKDKYELRGALRLLLSETLWQFSLLSDIDKADKVKWLLRLVQEIYRFKADTFQNLLRNYRIYPTKSGTYDWADNIFKVEKVPEEMLDYYNCIVNKEAKEEKDKADIREKVLDSRFDDFYIGTTVKDNVVLGKEMMDLMVPSSISDDNLAAISSHLVNEYKDVTANIIDKIRNEEGTTDHTWRDAFPKIAAIYPKILLLLIPPKESGKIIRLISGKAKINLDSIIELAENPDFDRIIELGKQALIQEKNDNSDFEYKKRLGNHVESLLRKELQDKFADIESIKVKTLCVKDQQDGQDIIVSYNDVDVFYIEVKSRWKTADSVEMSKRQLEQSINKKDCYALCAIDMTQYPRENALEHIYPNDIEETLSRMKVLTNIGELNDIRLRDVVENERNDSSIHIGGDYKDVVPQKVINANYTDITGLVEAITNEINKICL